MLRARPRPMEAWREVSDSAGDFGIILAALRDELVEQAAVRAAELLAEDVTEPAGFLDVNGAAEFLVCPKSRIYALVSARRIPHYKDGSRLLFDRGELHAYVRNGGSKRP
jgi:excisionase family DNA binding protein